MLGGFGRPVRLPFNEIRVTRQVKYRGYVVDDRQTNDLMVVLGRLADVVEKSNPRILRRDLVAAGFTRDGAAKAHRWLWQCKAPVPVTAGMSEKQINSIISKARRENGDLRKLIRLVRAIAEMFKSDAEYVRGVTIERDVNGEDVVRIRWRERINKDWNVPTLAMDATGDRLHAGALFPGLTTFVEASATMPNVRIRQVPWSASAGKLIIKEGADLSNDEKRTRHNNTERCRQYIQVRAAEFRGRGKEFVSRDGTPRRVDVLVVCQEGVEDQLKAAAGLPFGVETCHFGNFVGIDRWRGVACIIIIGRTQPSQDDVEMRAEVLFDREITPVETENGWYPKVPAGVRIRGAELGPTIYVDQHPDPYAEAVRWQICEGALVQAIGRGRGVNRTEADPLQIDVITDVVLPVEVDELVEWKVAQYGPLEVMIAIGYRLGEGRDASGMAVRLFPDGWKNEHAYRQANYDLNVRNANNKLSISESDVENLFVRFSVQRQDARYGQDIEINVTLHPHPKAGIGAQLGVPLSKFQLAADITAGCPRDFLVMQFAARPTRFTRHGPDGKLIEFWRDYRGTLIAPPIDAPPSSPPPAPTRGNLFHRRNPRLVRFSEPDGEGHQIVTWYRRDSSEVPGPAGDLDEVGESVDAEHQAAVAVMSDSEIEAALMARGHGAPPEAVAAFAARVRVMAAGSPQASIAIFMRDRRWRYRSRSVPSEAAE
jgi:putative DNA primase/helicase